MSPHGSVSLVRVLVRLVDARAEVLFRDVVRATQLVPRGHDRALLLFSAVMQCDDVVLVTLLVALVDAPLCAAARGRVAR